MKKIISSIVAIFLAIILLSNVSAVEVSTDTIAAGSYLIGTYLFDRDGSSSYDGTLTVRHIMLASKTIPGNTIEDMQILYNRARDGVWVDALTNETVEMPAKVNIEQRNLEQMLVAPTLASGLGGSHGTRDLNIIEGGAYGYEDMWNSIDGFELYEKDGEELTLVDEYEPTGVAIVKAEPGETKTYVARVFVYNSKNQKVYSDYSNEYVVENTLPAPTLASGLGGSHGTRDLNIIECGAYGYEDMWNSIDGFELYEKYGDKLTLVDEYEPTGVAIVMAQPGETKTYVARVFVYNSKNQKVYSDYSNEYTITNTATAALGDIDNNGVVDENDAYLLRAYLMEEDTLDEQGMKNADMNGDDVVNDDDYPILIQYLLDGNNTPFYEPTKNVTKLEYYIFGELAANEYLISVPESVEIEWNGEYQFSDASVIYDVELFRLPPDLDELPRFKGWYLDEEGTNKFDISQQLNGTTKLYAIFDLEFIIKYDGNGATSGEMLDSVHIIGETSNLSKNTYTRTGYKFIGWTEDLDDPYVKYPDEGEIQLIELLLFTENVPYTIYAVWEKNVEIGDVNGDGYVDVLDWDELGKYLYDNGEYEIIEEAADVNLDGEIDDVDYVIFLAYCYGSGVDALPYDSGEKYKITYDLNGGELEFVNYETYAEISLPFSLNNPIREGYVFTGWTGSNGDIPQTEVTIPSGTTGDLEYTANWEWAE